MTEGRKIRSEQVLAKELRNDNETVQNEETYKEEIASKKYSDVYVSTQQSIVAPEKPRVSRFSGGEGDVETSWLFEHEKTEQQESKK